jgi:hypothetical protein
MFFVSEEFLRKYEAGEAFGSTLDEVTAPGESLFPQAHSAGEGEHRSKAERAAEARRRSQGAGDPA